MRRPSLLAVACLLASCASQPWTQDADQMQEIQRLEELRPDGAEAALAGILARGSAWLRQRAARALGRIGSTATVTPLCTALGDTDLDVRKEVAFALGQLEIAGAQSQALGALLPMLATTERSFLARVVEAIGKLGEPSHIPTLSPYLEHTDVEIRESAVLALHRIRSRTLAAMPPQDRAQSTIGAEIRDAILRLYDAEASPEVRWQMLYALGAFRDPSCLERFRQSASASRSLWERFFAVRGIAELARAKRIPATEVDKTLDVVLQRLEDNDSRVAIEAAHCIGDPSPGGRGNARREAAPPFDQRRALDALAAKLQSKNAALVEACVRGLGHFRSLQSEANSALNLAIASPRVRIRATAIEANARLIGNDYAGVLRVYAKDDDWRIRAAVARATQFLAKASALPLLSKLVRDEENKVRLATMIGLQARSANLPRVEAELVDLAVAQLRESDVALREEAAATLGMLEDPRAVQALREALLKSRSPTMADARVAIIEALSKLAPRDATTPELFEAALDDPFNRVRRAAWTALSARGDGRPVPRLRLTDEARKAALPGREYPATDLGARPVLELETTKGTIAIELDTAAAPSHVYNILHFVRKGAYDGRIFHRVVPNFVVQGADARGDGYGNATWWGGKLRREVAPNTRFDAFAVGMPRGPDLDSGGDQLFVTLVPTPHLDGRYTRFGRVIEGFDVVLALAIGDRIEQARVRGE